MVFDIVAIVGADWRYYPQSRLKIRRQRQALGLHLISSSEAVVQIAV